MQTESRNNYQLRTRAAPLHYRVNVKLKKTNKLGFTASSL